MAGVISRRGQSSLTVGLALVVLALVVLALVFALTAVPHPAATGVHRKRRRGPHAIIANARPVWNGDTFTIRATNTRLPPYQFSSSSGPDGGWLQPSSNTNPNVDGVTVVDDPMGLSSSVPPYGVRKVIKLTTDERRSFAGQYVRTELRGPQIFRAGQTRWVIVELYIPPGTPVMPRKSREFWTVMSIFGSPYEGASPNSFQLARNRAGTGNDIVWDLPNGIPIWHTPATPGVWHILARRIEFDSDPRKGYSEVWYSQRAPDGSPRTPLIRQVVGGEGGIPLSHRRYYRTLDPAHNWDGTPNHPDLKNYHTAGMWPGRRFISLYFARYRVYDGATPVEEIDPYYTGLR